MASGTIFGLALIGAGVLMTALSTVLTEAAANTQSYFRPNLDKPAFNVETSRCCASCSAPGLSWALS